MTMPHAVIWMDHREAHIIEFALDASETAKVRQHGGPRSLHHHSGSIGSGHASEDHKYFDEIVKELGDAREILITGPGTAKTAFGKDLESRHKSVSERVVGVETLDHPTDAQLLAFAKKYFVRVDNLLGD
jgi:stalled ribosome rescue protein Dom34